MARIKIEDLPILEDLGATETKGIFGGASTISGGPSLQQQLREIEALSESATLADVAETISSDADPESTEREGTGVKIGGADKTLDETFMIKR